MILIIETSSVICSVAVVSENGELIAEEFAAEKNAHAEVLPQMVNKWMQEKFSAKEFKAVAICKGPGSYTGLRIGTSLAKGVCFANGLPLISVSSFRGMAYSGREKHPSGEIFIAMLDARRDDVYVEIFNNAFEILHSTEAITLTEEAFEKYHDNEVIICGNSNEKWDRIVQGFSNIHHYSAEPMAKSCAEEVAEKFKKGEFEDIAYFEPFYLKDFIPGISQKKPF